MTTEQIWNDERPVSEVLAEELVPAWIDADITCADVIAIVQGGCASGAYMPAVTYHTARQVMDEHGDQANGVLDYLEEVFDDLPSPPKGSSWAGMAVHFLSTAVELWALTTLQQLEDRSIDAD